MKEIKNNNKKGIFKKIFIKICRFFGYEIIDQNTFEIPTLNKSLNEEYPSPPKTDIFLQ